MKTIDVSTPSFPGKLALVDDEDYPAVSAFSWRYMRNWYVSREESHANKRTMIYLHTAYVQKAKELFGEYARAA